MSAPEKMSRRDEMETLLPFYLNGTLDGDELVAVEEWLASDPTAAAALEDAELEFSGTTSANEAIRPPADALSRFSKALDAEAPRVTAESAKSFLASLRDRFFAIPVGVAWAAAAAALAFALVQAVVEPSGRIGEFEVAGSEDERARMPFALVTFKPDARMADIVDWLGDNGATVLAGPASGGVFKIGVPAENAADYDRLVGLIAAQPFAQTVLPGKKP